MQSLNVAIRDAWLELRQNKQLLDLMTDLLVEDAYYLKLLSRIGGLHNFGASEMSNSGAVEARYCE
ncbi:MAG: hypothetical protein KDD69_17745 [Bdellovibrionales bacterium]|nr:hypothetical protein [Bdellovibrionales bacterium]